MVAVQNLLDSDGDVFFIQEGESHNITGQLSDADGVDIALSGLSTFTITLYNEDGNAIINSRDDQDAKNLNDHTIAAGGSFVVRFDPADAVIVVEDPVIGETNQQFHIARLTWTWNDGTSVRTGIEQVRFGVQKLEVTV